MKKNFIFSEQGSILTNIKIGGNYDANRSAYDRAQTDRENDCCDKIETEKCKLEGRINPEFIDLAVDFIRTYADRCHHGKEEDILFRDLDKKPLSADQRRILAELIEEHKQGRETVVKIVEAKAKYENGDTGALTTILNCLGFITDFYPKHIEKEDRHFFLPCMEHFSIEERDTMLHEEWEFDKNLVHLLYTEKVKRAEML